MKYAKKLHAALLPYFNVFKKADEDLKAAETPAYIKHGETLTETEKKIRDCQREIETEKAKEAYKAAKEEFAKAINTIPAELRAKYSNEIEGEFAFNAADVDDKLITLLNSTACRPIDFITLYRSTGNMTNKRLIAEKLHDYTDKHRKEMSPMDIEASVAILAEVNTHNPQSQLASFEAVNNAYTQFMQSDTIVRTLPIWAQSVGLEME